MDKKIKLIASELLKVYATAKAAAAERSEAAKAAADLTFDNPDIAGELVSALALAGKAGKPIIRGLAARHEKAVADSTLESATVILPSGAVCAVTRADVLAAIQRRYANSPAGKLEAAERELARLRAMLEAEAAPVVEEDMVAA